MRLPCVVLSVVSAGLLVSCGTITHHVSKDNLEARLRADTRTQHEQGGRPWYQWSYIGSDSKHHYFRRQVGRVLVFSEPHDGVYLMPRKAMVLQDVEFSRPAPDDSTRWKEALTQRDEHGFPTAYSTRFGVSEPPN